MFRKRKIISLIFASCCILLLTALGVFVAQRQAQKAIRKVSVTIDNEYNNYFISDREVKNILTNDGEKKLEGSKITDVDLKSLELRIKSHKFVRDAQVYRDLAGNLNVKIKQNRPIARIVHDNSDEDVYIDDEGNILPLSERFTARVIPITRSLFRPAQTRTFYQDSLGQAYLDLLKFIEKDTFWKAQLAEMQIDAKGKVIFMPQVGTQAIEFGKPEGVEQKFKKLLVFYKKVLPAMGWERYKRVNLEFDDQIICE
ncbi:hypothetical protein HUW51_16755 [Adhaeribacter swui]|uniref:Cell division protein FtsQ n=1 Tax=Adhaeribacter swui TaxID=2086471 RepID=A0A7G7GAV7_9BACT|nr:hypothetical protein [Adhaeribacter swui]QNF34291.1 hypothetical protein HUW51_16755 [Adhaeribacter swui]